MNKYVTIASLVAIGILTLLLFRAEKDPVIEHSIQHDSVLVVRTHIDTVTIAKFFPIIRGTRHDTVTRDGQPVMCPAFSYDTTLDGYHLQGDVDCEAARLSIAIDGREPVMVHDTMTRVQTVERTVVERHRPLALSVFAETDLLETPTVKLSSLGLSGTLTLTPFTLYVNPCYDFNHGLRATAGLSVTLLH